MNEIWKDIIGYEWIYQISNLWRVKSLNYNRQWIENILKRDTYSKYGAVRLHKNWKGVSLRISRLVATAFIPNPENLPFVLHRKEDLDENGSLYNWVDNLWWWTAKDNAIDRAKKWRWYNFFKESKLSKWKFWKDHLLSKRVDQYTKEWVFVKTWDSMMDVKRALWIYPSSIASCCKKTRSKSAWWFLWEYSGITK